MGDTEKIFHAVSLSGGKDSTAMLLLIIERGMPIDMVLTADTGMEFPEMYEHLAKLDEYHNAVFIGYDGKTPRYPNLSDMDLEFIPKTTTEDGRTLQFADVQWQTDNTENVDDDPIGDRFTAVVTYTGTASSKNVTGYTVTAQYSGEVEKISLDKVQYVAIFHGTPLEPSAVEVPEDETDAATADWRYIAIPAVLLMLCAAGFAAAKMKTKKGRTEHETILDADYISAENSKVSESDAADSDSADHYPGVGS